MLEIEVCGSVGVFEKKRKEGVVKREQKEEHRRGRTEERGGNRGMRGNQEEQETAGEAG